MTLSVGRVLADAWALWRRDRDLLVRIGAPFLFLPAWAIDLLAPRPTPADDAGWADAFRLAADYFTAHAGALLAAGAAAQLGTAALTAFYCAPGARDVADALRRGAILWPRFIIAAFVVQALAWAGLLVLVVGAFAVLGRALLTGPLLVSRRPVSAVGAIGRSVRATAGQTLPTAALAAIVTVGGPIAAEPFAELDRWLRLLHAPNPVPLAAIDGVEAGVMMLTSIAAVLVAVSAYRALGGASSGI